MSTTWYRYNQYAFGAQKQISPVQIVKETAQQVVFLDSSKYERRAVKAGEFFPTFEEAKAYAVDRLTNRIRDAKKELARRENELEAIIALEETK